MSEMVDRIAKALCIADGHNFEQQASDNGDPVDMKMWETYKSFARLTIEAMREPTDFMVLTALEQAYANDRALVIEDWGQMIDAALEK